MTVPSLISTRRRGRALFARLALACALALPFASRTFAAEEQHELEESTITELEKLTPLTNGKNWDGALALVTALASKVPADSYDKAFLYDIEAKIYLQKGDYAKALPPWEKALQMTDQHHYFTDSAVQDMIYFMAQIYYQEASNTKVPELQKQYFAKATTYLERWMKHTTKPDRDPMRQDAQLFYASLLYNEAAANGPDKVDLPLLRKADAEVQKGLRMSVHPKETFYVLALAIAQNENDYARLAELLELLVKQSPGKKDYWSQLGGVYLNLAATEKDEAKAREYNTRAILAIERAQALGFMKTPKDNYTLVGIYFNVGQFGRATELLHAGLRDGTIESDQKNWELLAYSYQQVDKPLEAVAALKEAGKHFPNAGQLDFQAAQIYYGLNRAQDAYNQLQVATRKDHFDKPGAVYGFLAYVCWEIGKLEEASAAVDKALEYPDGQKDQQLPKLKDAIKDQLAEREAAKTRINSL